MLPHNSVDQTKKGKEKISQFFCCIIRLKKKAISYFSYHCAVGELGAIQEKKLKRVDAATSYVV